MKKHHFLILVILLSAAVLLSGCGLFSGGGKEDIDPPQDVTYEDDINKDEDATGERNEDGNDQLGENTKTIQTQLYLIDKNGYVVPRTFALPFTESVAKQALEYLVQGGPITNLIPNDFRAVLPEGTEVSVDIQNGVATVDFSNEFAEYAPEDESRILESVLWTLSQFDSIKTVKLQMNGHPLSEMPVNGTPIHGDLTKNIGINSDLTGVVDITNTRPLTIYYIAQTDEESYFVPVTKRVPIKDGNLAKAVVQELVKGPDLQSPLFTALMYDVELLEDPEVKDGVVTLNFNENIFSSFDKKMISDQVLHSIVLSLTELDGIEAVSIQVRGETDIVNQEGETLSESVSRPKQLNTGSY